LTEYSPQAARLPETAAALHTRRMFSKEVLDHFQNPRNAGVLKDATAVVDVTNPVCGDILKVAVRVANGQIVEARFLCRGCTTAIACASRLTELLTKAAQQSSRNHGGCSKRLVRGIASRNNSRRAFGCGRRTGARSEARCRAI